MSKLHRVFSSADRSDISRQVGSGIKVNLSARVGRLVLQMGSTVVLARLLTPEDYGVVAMVAVVANFIGMFKDAGLAHATVQAHEMNHSKASALFWLNFAVSGVLAVVVVLGAPLIAFIYGDSRLVPLSVAFGLLIGVSGLSLQHRALLQRSMRFMEIAMAELVGLFLGIVVAILCAVKGYGYWSLFVMHLVNRIVETMILWWRTGWLPGFYFRGQGVRPLLEFGMNLTGYNSVHYMTRNLDNFLIAKFVGADVLGNYSRAYNIMMAPLSQVSYPISKAIFPALSRLRDDSGEYNKLYLRVICYVAWFTAVPVAICGVFSEAIVGLMLGPGWGQAAELFSWLAIAGILQPLSSLLGVLFTSLGKTQKLLKMGIVSGLATVCSFVIGIQFGVVGLAIAYAITANLQFPFLVWYAHRNSTVPVSQFWLVTAIPIVCAYGISLFNII